MEKSAIKTVSAEMAVGCMPQYDVLAEALLPQIRDFFADPETEAEFQRWLKERKEVKAG